MKTGLRKSGKLAGGLGLLLVLALIASFALPALAAVPAPPHTFKGSVTVCGEPAEEGTVVTATIAGAVEDWTTTVDSDGNYGYEPTFTVPSDDPETPEKDGGVGGDTVQLWVLGQLAGQAQFKSLGLTELDLEVFIDVELTVDASPPGGGTVTGSGTYTCCTNAPITATEADGWDFVSWSTDDMTEIASPSSPSTTLTLDKDKTVTANFVEEGVTYYTLDMEVVGSGTVTPEDGSYPEGDMPITAAADPGWEFDSWSTDDMAEIASPSSPSTTLTLDKDKTVTATFSVLKVSYVLTMNVEGGGTVTPESGTYPEGDMTITATADPGWRFAGWSTDDIAEIADPASPSTTLTLDKDKTVTATFTERVGFTTPLFFDWNLVSTPITLDADSDTLEQIFDAESVNNILILYRWDAVAEDWDQILADYELLPLEAIYVKVKPDASAIAEFIPSGELTWPPTRDLVEGLNLIGPAPELEDGVFPTTPLDQALISIAEIPGGLTGYVMVISPEHNQPGWAYALGGEVHDLLPYKGYWVVMINAGTLHGFSTTPIQ